MCAPRRGPVQRIAPGSSGTCGTTPACRTFPNCGSSTSRHHAALAELRVRRDLGRRIHQGAGMSASVSMRSASVAVRPFVQAPMMRSSSSTFLTRVALP